ncbi:MAG: sulfite exporter TauE/SafE family protein [Francisellaceae bacterium]|nr:sulfite exporter TauE/SafE family protein [Francisellaceae bacterium]
MSVIEVTLLLFFLAWFAGGVGSLTGLGGGLIIIPLLGLLNIDMHQAMGAGLMVSLSNSLMASIIFNRSKLVHLKLGIFLETATALGALIAGFFLNYLSIKWAAYLLGSLMFIAIGSSIYFEKKKTQELSLSPDYFNKKLPSKKLGMSWILMVCSGSLSALLGIGSGSLKVLAMDLILGVPYKISAATSNFMIGITTTVSLGAYVANGFINFQLIAPTILGAAFGSWMGSNFLIKAPTRILRNIFNLIILILALELFKKGFSS